MPPKRAPSKAPTNPENGTFPDENTEIIGKKRGRPPNPRKKVRPPIHPAFTNRGRRALFHAERGFVHAWHQCHPELSICDLAHTFNISEGQVRGIITTSITSYEEFLLNSKGRSDHHRSVIEARMAELERIRTPEMSSYDLAEQLTGWNGFPCCTNTVRSDLWDLG